MSIPGAALFRALLLACLASVVALGAVQLARAEDQAVVRLILSADQAGVGDLVTAEIWIEGAPYLRGAEVHVGFDPAKLQVEDADPEVDGIQIEVGPLLLDGFSPGGLGNYADNTQGLIGFARVAIIQPPELFQTYIMPDGVLAGITFRAVADGSAPIDFTSVSLLDRAIEPIPCQSVGATLTIGADPTPTTGPTSVPTSTPPPTATPTPPATATPAPTPAPTPTPTLAPSSTPTAPPSPTPTLAPEAAPTAPPSPTPTPVVSPTPTSLATLPTPTNTPCPV